MANNPQSSGAQPLRPPPVGSMGPQNFVPPYPMQFRPVIPTQQGQPFISSASASQQFRPVGQGISPPNAGIPSNQAQPQQYSQPMQQLPPRPAQPAHMTPASQAIPMPYIQQNMPLTSSSPLSQQTAPTMSNHMPSLTGPGVPLPSSYTFVPSSFGQPQNAVPTSSQFQPLQMHAPVAPVGVQPWMSTGSQGGPLVTPVQQGGLQSSETVATASAVNAPGTAQQSSDWQEHTSQDGRRYYYNKKTRQSSWEKPLELMTPIEMSWQVRGI
ncbi:hypothetical protein NMG60_11016564 [Bertholletia excelsa]